MTCLAEAEAGNIPLISVKIIILIMGTVANVRKHKRKYLSVNYNDIVMANKVHQHCL